MVRKGIIIMVLFGILSPGYVMALQKKDLPRCGQPASQFMRLSEKCIDQVLTVQQYSQQMWIVLDNMAEMQGIRARGKDADVSTHIKTLKKSRKDLTKAIKAYRKCINSIELEECIILHK